MTLLVLAGCGGATAEESATTTQRVTTIATTTASDVADSVDLPHPRGAKIGHWRWAALSPDGKTWLAQWSAECEVPFAFLVPADGGEAKVVTGEEDWTTAPESEALGWTTDGEPIVRLLRGVCGTGADEPGVYVFGAGEPRRVDDGLEPSLTPRDVG